ncbi:MAG: LamG domain-containing protein [Acidobacteria bacterium]|nr:LamG domain-containing protein [Acidobacteriota bacterium]
MKYQAWILISLLIAVYSWACSSSPEPIQNREAAHKRETSEAIQPPPERLEEKSPMPPGVIGYWPFDEGSGTVAKDASGTADGTIHEASWAQGRMAGALRFSGSTTYVEIPDRPALSPSGPFEVSLWMYIEERPLGYATLIEKGGGFTGSFRLVLLKNGKIRAGLGHDYVTVNSSITPSLKQWHQIDMTYTGRELQLKIDGQLVASRQVTKPDVKSAYNVIIGRGLVGMIDEVKIATKSS